jgi:hypothetical protein
MSIHWLLHDSCGNWKVFNIQQLAFPINCNAFYKSRVTLSLKGKKKYMAY